MRTMRLSQTISPFGVGAVLDVLGESLMGADISEWPYDKTVRVPSKRLEQALGVLELRSPPSVPSRPSKNTPGIVYQRFPRWLFCQDCRRMRFALGADETGEPPKCKDCKDRLVPMRFIAVCTKRGHATDVPWDRWAHSEPKDDEQRRCQAPALVFDTTRGGSEGLSSLVVKCTTCQAERHLGELTSRESLKRIGFHCPGRQPWQRGQHPACDERLEVLQRGATNVTLSESTTALDIPEPVVPARDVNAEIRQHRNFEDVRSAPAGPRAPVLIEMIAEDLNLSVDVVRRAVTSDEHPDSELREARTGLLNAEWLAFMQAVESPDEPTGTPDFVVSATPLLPGNASPPQTSLQAALGDVVLVHRLREVRVLHGFRRYDQEADLVDVNLDRRGMQRWLPAVESFGEGVFFNLDAARLQEWEAEAAVLSRVRILEQRRRDSVLGGRLDEATPRLILLHTLSHLIMRQLAFSCGYSAASLRERIYASVGTVSEAGILIYTAAGDAEGTLGGLVRQGEAPRLAATVLSALEQASWCSNDPICLESRGQGLGSLNLASCHGCCLVAETSCERSNVMLDRALLLGDTRTPGYFTQTMELMRTATAARG